MSELLGPLLSTLMPRDRFLAVFATPAMFAETPVETFSSAEICLARRLESSGRSYVLHELLADWSDVLGEGGAEHHHLLLVRSQAEDVLHVSTHVCRQNVKLGNSVDCS